MAVAFIGIIQYILGNVSQIWQDAGMFGDIRGRTVSAFGNPNVLGEYLVLVIPAIFAMFLCSNTFKTKMLFFVTLALCSVCLVLTWSRGAWLGLIIASIVFILVKSHTFLAYITVALPGLTLAFSFIMNGKVMKRLFSIGSMADSSTAYRWNIWNGVWDMLADKGLYGIGTGEGAFTSVFPQYAVSGTESVPHTHSLYLQLMAETGVFSLLCFLLVCLAYFSLVFAYIRKAIGKRNRTMSIGFLCGILAFLLQGLTDYVWYSYKVYLFFWITLGFAMAVLNICKENDRRRYLH
jgi:putative inorganic carbon (HCO3(-)) transporter